VSELKKENIHGCVEYRWMDVFINHMKAILPSLSCWALLWSSSICVDNVSQS
jgi:hypothetical protein